MLARPLQLPVHLCRRSACARALPRVSCLSSHRAGEERTDFGSREVPKSQKAGLVHEVFRSVAEKYDLMNDLMSLGAHRLWKDKLVAESGLERISNYSKSRARPSSGMAVLDLASGTGDVAFRLARALGPGAFVTEMGPRARMVASDVNEAMLEVGKGRAAEAVGASLAKELEWAVVDAQDIPFEDNHFDLVTIAFGLRNVTDRETALREIRRVLRPGGRFMCLEFTPAVTGLHSSVDSALDSVYKAYSFNVIPRLGAAIAGDAESYQYLVESIRRFPSPQNLAEMMRDAGLRQVKFEALPPGVVAIHSGYKITTEN